MGCSTLAFWQPWTEPQKQLEMKQEGLSGHRQHTRSTQLSRRDEDPPWRGKRRGDAGTAGSLNHGSPVPAQKLLRPRRSTGHRNPDPPPVGPGSAQGLRQPPFQHDFLTLSAHNSTSGSTGSDGGKTPQTTPQAGARWAGLPQVGCAGILERQ